MDLLWYGFPWHAQQIYREIRRQSHIACSSNSLRVAFTQISVEACRLKSTAVFGGGVRNKLKPGNC